VVASVSIEKEHDLRTFSQHRNPDDQSQRIEGPIAAEHRLAECCRGPRQLAAVPVHPDIVPTEHGDRGKQDCSVEQLLSDAIDRGGDPFGAGGDEGGAKDACGDPAGYPDTAARHASARRQHDADNQRCFEDLAKDDDCGRQHLSPRYFTTRWPRVSGWKSSKNS
jgi:hypothetical protein